MRDYITKLYEALENFDCEQVGEIYFEMRDGNLLVGEEDIVSLKPANPSIQKNSISCTPQLFKAFR